MPKRPALSSPWLPTAALTFAGFLAGSATTSLLVLGIESSRVEQISNKLAIAQGQIEALTAKSSAINLSLSVSEPTNEQDSVQVQVQTVLPNQPKPAANAQPPSGSLPPQLQIAATAATSGGPKTPPPAPPKVAAPPALPKPGPAPAAAAQTPGPKQASATPVNPGEQTVKAGGMELPLPSTSTPSPGGAQLSQQSTKQAPIVPVADSEVKAAMATNSIEMAPKAKMGVSKVESGVVIMGSGARIAIGERFVSGERLLSVDTEAGKIVTDKRTVVLMN